MSKEESKQVYQDSIAGKLQNLLHEKEYASLEKNVNELHAYHVQTLTEIEHNIQERKALSSSLEAAESKRNPIAKLFLSRKLRRTILKNETRKEFLIKEKGLIEAFVYGKGESGWGKHKAALLGKQIYRTWDPEFLLKERLNSNEVALVVLADFLEHYKTEDRIHKLFFTKVLLPKRMPSSYYVKLLELLIPYRFFEKRPEAFTHLERVTNFMRNQFRYIIANNSSKYDKQIAYSSELEEFLTLIFNIETKAGNNTYPLLFEFFNSLFLTYKLRPENTYLLRFFEALPNEDKAQFEVFLNGQNLYKLLWEFSIENYQQFVLDFKDTFKEEAYWEFVNSSASEIRLPKAYIENQLSSDSDVLMVACAKEFLGEQLAAIFYSEDESLKVPLRGFRILTSWVNTYHRQLMMGWSNPIAIPSFLILVKITDRLFQRVQLHGLEANFNKIKTEEVIGKKLIRKSWYKKDKGKSARRIKNEVEKGWREDPDPDVYENIYATSGSILGSDYRDHAMITGEILNMLALLKHTFQESVQKPIYKSRPKSSSYASFSKPIQHATFPEFEEVARRMVNDSIKVFKVIKRSHSLSLEKKHNLLSAVIASPFLTELEKKEYESEISSLF